jgi:glycosyltransferase involved in cell wall biosynthesis
VSIPKVSVIIPVYNIEDYLSQSLESVLGQTLKELEVLCVNDGSTDGSLNLLKEYQSKDDRIRIIDKENGGQGIARNKAIKLAKGEYIAFVDGDDWIKSTMYEELYQKAKRHDAEIAMCDYEHYFESSGTLGRRWRLPISDKFDGKVFKWQDVKNEIFRLKTGCWSRIYLNSFLQANQIQFAEGVIYEDDIFSFKSLLLAKKMVLVRKPFYKYRQEREGQTTQETKKVFDIFKVTPLLEDFLKSHEEFNQLAAQFTDRKVRKYCLCLHKRTPPDLMKDFFYQLKTEFKKIENPLIILNRYLPFKLKMRTLLVKYAPWSLYRSAFSGFSVFRAFKKAIKENSFYQKSESALRIDFKSKIIKKFKKKMICLLTPDLPSKQSYLDKIDFLLREKNLKGAERYLIAGRKKHPESPSLKQRSKKLLRLKLINAEKAAIKENEKVIERIKKSVKNGNKLKIGFLVNDNTKWNGDSLKEEFDKYGNIEFKLYLTITGRDKSRAKTAQTYLKEREFFLKIDPNLVDLYDVKFGRRIPLSKFDNDLIFYQQPWGMKHLPRKHLGQSLALNMHYGYSVYANTKKQFNMEEFHPFLWKYFSQSELHKKVHLKHNPDAKRQLVVTGYPKLDVFYSKQKAECKIWPSGNAAQKRVIYAPHHSMTRGTKISTFDWNYDLLFDLAKENPEIDWVYKPHGKLKYVVERHQVMSFEAYAEYEKAWNDLKNGVVYDKGAYFDIFKTSDAMITDSGSFLGEYMLTDKPIIWLYSDDSMPLNAVGADLSRSFYKVTNREEIVDVFNEVVVKGNDWLSDVRREVIESHFSKKEMAAEKIVNYIRNHFHLHNVTG